VVSGPSASLSILFQRVESSDRAHVLTKPGKGVRSKAWAVDLVAVTHEELFGEIIQVCKGQLARIVALTYAQVDNAVIDDVAIHITDQRFGFR